MTQRHSGGDREQPQSIVGPITLDEPRVTAVPIPVGGSVTPAALGFGGDVVIQSATCAAGVLTLAVACNAKASHITVTVPGAGSVPVVIPAVATLVAIARTDADLVVTAASSNAEQPVVTLPAAAGNITVTVADVRVI